MTEETVRRTRRVEGRTLSWMGSTIPFLPNAACKKHPDPMWDFEMDDVIPESVDQRAARHMRAKRVCAGCPDQVDCFLWATQNEVYGVWGQEVFVPPGIAYHRCKNCGIGLIRSRRRLPPPGLANPGREGYCAGCFAVAKGLSVIQQAG